MQKLVRVKGQSLNFRRLRHMKRDGDPIWSYWSFDSIVSSLQWSFFRRSLQLISNDDFVALLQWSVAGHGQYFITILWKSLSTYLQAMFWKTDKSENVGLMNLRPSQYVFITCIRRVTTSKLSKRSITMTQCFNGWDFVVCDACAWKFFVRCLLKRWNLPKTLWFF